MSERTHLQGPQPGLAGIGYRIWAPGRRVAVQVFDEDGVGRRIVELSSDDVGYHHGIDERGRAGDRYLLRVDRATYPCPASRFQPESVEGPSQVVSSADFAWTDRAWKRPPFRDLVIYELHVGTFSSGGTFRGAIERLDHLQELGVNAIELMPIADFPGERNWGYDGVRLYAPARVYGTPDDLRALVDAAHARGLAVILDVVYNHFGPDGNFLRQFSGDYFESRHHTPWGEAINFSNRPVRDYYVGNVLYWMEDFHIDGFRLDATHEIFDDSPTHILAELAEAVHERGGYIIAEDERNDARLIDSTDRDGFGLDAVWADDFHHTVEAALIETSRYRRDFTGNLRELVTALEQGWLVGFVPPRKTRRRATACGHLPPERFVFCISNHDQAGNRAFGERLNHLVSAETYRAASALLCLSPYTPLLFMGQEWAASTPFLFFTDHRGELGRLVEEGRQREFKDFAAIEKRMGRKIPSPQNVETFENSKLQWDEATAGGHAGCLRLYREALRLRREHEAFRPKGRENTKVAELKSSVLAIRAGADWLILADLLGNHRGDLADEEVCRLEAGRIWRAQFSSNDPAFGGVAERTSLAGTKFEFQMPELLVLKAETE